MILPIFIICSTYSARSDTPGEFRSNWCCGCRRLSTPYLQGIHSQDTCFKNSDVDVLVKHGPVNELRKAVEGMIVVDDVIELHSKQVELGF